MASNESNHRVRTNKFSTKHAFGQRKKGRTQQLRDARANRTFSVAKQPDTAEMQPCVVTADDELATPRTPATVGSRTVAQVKHRGGTRARIQGWQIQLNVVEPCLSCGLCCCLVVS